MALETTLGTPRRPLGRTVASSAASTVNSLPPTVLNRKFIGKCLILTVAAGKGHWSSGSEGQREGTDGNLPAKLGAPDAWEHPDPSSPAEQRVGGG